MLDLGPDPISGGLLGTAVRSPRRRPASDAPLDRGLWVPDGDVPRALRRGRVDFTLLSDRLEGRFSLLRFRTTPGAGEYWHLRAQPVQKFPRLRRRSGGAVRLPGAVPAPFPSRIRPALAMPALSPPEGEGWLHEVSRGGVRMLARLDGRAVRLLARGRRDWSRRLPVLARELSSLPARSAILDGELVALLPRGTSSPNLLRRVLSGGTQDELFFFVFDLIYLDGSDLRRVPLLDRKRALARLLAGSVGSPHVKYSDHIRGRGALFHRLACDLSLEGMLSRPEHAPYRPGRRSGWLKLVVRPERGGGREWPHSAPGPLSPKPG